jgi:hypothetical protein
MKLYHILFIVFIGLSFEISGQQIVQAEFVSSSNFLPQLRLTSLNGQVNEMSTNDDGDFVIWMNGMVTEDRFRILDQNGFIGINNPNPQRQLDVNGSANISSVLFSNLARIGNNADGSAWQLGVNGDQINRDGKLFLINKANPTGPDDMGVSFENNTGGTRWSVYLNEDTDQDGIPFNDLDFAFNNVLKGFISDLNGAYFQTSDARLKKNISDMEPVLKNVMKLNTKKYQYTDNAETDPHTIGFLAQEVYSLFPEIVTNDRDYLGLDYSGFGVIAIQAIQEQQVLIDSQDKTIDNLSKTLEKSNAKISRLEAIVKKLVAEK